MTNAPLRNFSGPLSRRCRRSNPQVPARSGRSVPAFRLGLTMAVMGAAVVSVTTLSSTSYIYGLERCIRYRRPLVAAGERF
jgi:hypothetical protein